jgi:hypothetical protein
VYKAVVVPSHGPLSCSKEVALPRRGLGLAPRPSVRYRSRRLPIDNGLHRAPAASPTLPAAWPAKLIEVAANGTPANALFVLLHYQSDRFLLVDILDKSVEIPRVWFPSEGAAVKSAHPAPGPLVLLHGQGGIESNPNHVVFIYRG